MTAFAGMAGEVAADVSDPLSAKKTHSAPKADNVIFIYATGGVSHIDSFDPKPAARHLAFH